MELVIGGCYQGKLDYIKERLASENRPLGDAQICCPDTDTSLAHVRGEKICVLYGLHQYVKKYLQGEGLPILEQEVFRLLTENPKLIIICDEVGSGVVPILKEETCYREAVGRLLCSLAKHAEKVTRIMAGMPMRIK